MMNKLIAATSTFEGPAIQWFKISPILALLGGALFLILYFALCYRTVQPFYIWIWIYNMLKLKL